MTRIDNLRHQYRDDVADSKPCFIGFHLRHPRSI